MANPESDNYVPPPLPESQIPFWARAPRPGESFRVAQTPIVLFVTGKNDKGWIVMTALGEFTIAKDAEGQWEMISTEVR